jgi:hypothetical protein
MAIASGCAIDSRDVLSEAGPVSGEASCCHSGLGSVATLRLSEPRYQRLRPFAFDRDASHQEIREAALMADLERGSGTGSPWVRVRLRAYPPASSRKHVATD